MQRKLLVFAILSLLLSGAAISQTGNSNNKDNLLFLLRQTEHIDQALKTVEQLQGNRNDNLNMGKVVIIVCGEAVRALGTKDADQWMDRIAKIPDVSLVACGLSLKKFKMTKGDLVEGVDYTENGFIRAFELQKQGYLSVEL